jgi:hypothetical protein
VLTVTHNRLKKIQAKKAKIKAEKKVLLESRLGKEVDLDDQTLASGTTGAAADDDLLF